MGLDWVEIGVELALNGLLFAAILAGAGYIAVKFFRPRVQQWIGGAIGNFMTNLMNQAEKEGVEGGGTPGLLKLGGFEIDVGTIKELLAIAPQALQIAKMFGLTGSGGGGSGTGGKIGL